MRYHNCRSTHRHKSTTTSEPPAPTPATPTRSTAPVQTWTSRLHQWLHQILAKGACRGQLLTICQAILKEPQQKKTTKKKLFHGVLASAPGKTRTSNPWFRRPVLYPIELRTQTNVDCGTRIGDYFSAFRNPHCIFYVIIPSNASPPMTTTMKATIQRPNRMACCRIGL